MHFLLILAVAAALVIVENGPPQPVPDSALRLALALVAMAGVGLPAGLGSAVITWRMRGGWEPRVARRWSRWLRGGSLALWLASAGFVLYGLKWGQLVRFNWGLRHVFLVPDLLILVPVVAPLVLLWTIFYQIDRAVRFSDAGAPGRGEYLRLHLRYYLGILLLPVLGLLAYQDLVVRLAPSLLGADSPWAAWMFGPPAVLLVVFFPCLLRYVWRTRPLEHGSLRQRLEDTARRAGLKVREILVWQTGGYMVNAAVTGFLPGLRYVLLSDGLLAQLSEEQIEAVFGHEVGHVRHRHLALRLLAMALPVSLCLLYAQLYPEAAARLGRLAGYAEDGDPVRSGLAAVAAMAVYVWAAFGWYCRVLEGQADLFGCRTASGASSVLAVDTFVSALERLAEVGGLDRKAPGWQHASIARRVEFLYRAAADPPCERRFQRRLRLLAGLITLGALGPWALRLWCG
jgi:STE24 endopeptidase